MADLDELKAQLEKVQKDMIELQKEADKSAKLEKELSETKKLVESYKTSSKTVYISKDKKLQKFSGRPVKDTDLTAEEWIEDAVYHLKNIEGSGNQVEFVYDHLTGQAKDEVRIRPESDRNAASKILDIIRQSFEDAETVAQLQQRFYQRNQKSDETLQTYSLILMKLLDRMVKKDKAILGDRDLMLTERFIDGVSDHQLRREMRRFTFEHKGMSFNDFRHMVLKWTEDEVEGRRRSTSSLNETNASEDVDLQSNVQKVKSQREATKVTANETGMQAQMFKLLQSQQEMLEKQQQQIDVLTGLVSKDKSESDRRTFPRQQGRTCYYCQRKGHIARDCLVRKRKETKGSTATPAAKDEASGKGDGNKNTPLNK